MNTSAATDAPTRERDDAGEPVLVVVDEHDTSAPDDGRQRHGEMLGASVLVIALTLFLRLDVGGGVEAPVGDGIRLPPLCMSRAWFGVDCPGCGLTRSFVALGNGDLHKSFAFHRLGWLLALAVALQVPYRLYELSRPRRPTPQRWKSLFGAALIVALLSNWAFKMVGM
jgi:hypothetical protein